MPLEIRRTAHINQIVADFEAAKTFYREIFDAHIFWEGWDEEARRDAALFLIGNTVLELFAPVDHESLLGASLARYGESWHSFEWLVDDLDKARATFKEAGVRLTTDRADISFFMTHPKDAHGILFEIYDGTNQNEPRDEPGWTDAPWRDGPLGILRLNAMTVAVRDLEAATAFFTDLSGGEVLYREHRPGVGNVAGIWVVDMFTELVEPDGADSPVAEYISTRGPRIRSVDFQVSDIAATTRHLQSHGLRIIGGDRPGDIAIDPRDNLGVLYRFTEASLPNDPRD